MAIISTKVCTVREMDPGRFLGDQGQKPKPKPKQRQDQELREQCRSEPARDEFEGSAFFQTARVIVQVHREQARSYSGYWIGVALLILTHLYREASFRAHGAGPERGHAEPQRGTERKGQERFGYFRLGRHSGFSKVTRRKGETNSRRYKKNGYTLN
jgi:hypothetical protein